MLAAGCTLATRVAVVFGGRIVQLTPVPEAQIPRSSTNHRLTNILLTHAVIHAGDVAYQQ
jgi:hypothetical protein